MITLTHHKTGQIPLRELEDEDFPETPLILCAAAVADAFLGRISVREFSTNDGRLYCLDYALSPAVELIKTDTMQGAKMLVPTKGNLILQQKDGEKICLAVGTVLLFNGDDYTISLPENCSTRYWLFAIDPLLQRMDWTTIPNGRYKVSAAMHIFLTQMDEPPQRLASPEDWLSLLLINFLFHLKEEISFQANPAAMNNYLQDYVLAADNYIKQNLTTNFSIKQVARKVALNATSLNKAFSAHFGMGIAKRQNVLRVEYAMRLLLQTDRTILEIARECGYDSDVVLRYNFVKITKLKPLTWRKRYKL